jgi:hypothetical protein
VAGLSVDILTLDIVQVVVVSAVDVNAEIRVFESMSMSWMAASSRDEIVKLVGCVWWVADQVFQCEGSQDERGWSSEPQVCLLLCAFNCRLSANLVHECYQQVPMCYCFQGILAI